MNIYDEAIATFHDMHPEYDTANGGTHLLHDKVLDALKCAKKEHELLELYRKLSKELHLEIETDWSDDWAGIHDFDTLDCQVDDLAIETFKQIKELEEGE